jgi:hypothetical protein
MFSSFRFLPYIHHCKIPTLPIFAKFKFSRKSVSDNTFTMDYIEDLDQAAMDAFSELNNECSVDITPTVKPSSEVNDLIRSIKDRPSPLPKAQRKSSNMAYLFKLLHPITPTILARAAILHAQPTIFHGLSSTGSAEFCRVTEHDIPLIKAWLAAQYPSILPVFAPIDKARKDFSPFSAYPTLGLDTTLPQYKPHSNSGDVVSPEQNEYPVWYFFYGTLADSEFLAQLFDSLPDSMPVLYRVRNKQLSGSWKGIFDLIDYFFEPSSYL